MAEARGLLIESVGNGYQAKGFQLYARLAGTGQGETGDAYRVYLQSVFDEFALDLPGLFDRFSPQGRLFPREAALLELLTQINHGEIEPLWAEDETIGWIYQYFNSKEERKAMRGCVPGAAQQPRARPSGTSSSRRAMWWSSWLTIRSGGSGSTDGRTNRFAQPLPVSVGETGRAARGCQAPARPKDDQGSRPRLRFDAFRPLRLRPVPGNLPRGLGSGSRCMAPGALDRATGGNPDLKPLSETYADQDEFLRDVPRLVIERNIYGVDYRPAGGADRVAGAVAESPAGVAWDWGPGQAAAAGGPGSCGGSGGATSRGGPTQAVHERT